MSNAEDIAERAMQAGRLQSWSELSSDEIKREIAKEIDKHTNQTLQELKEKVIKQLEDLGIPNMVSKKELYNVMDVSTPQEIGEIKAKLEFLDLIDEVRNE